MKPFIASPSAATIAAALVLLASGNVSAQPADWHRTTDLDRQFEADWKVCAAQSTKPLPKVSDGTTQLRGQGNMQNMQTPLGARLGLVPYGNWQAPGSTSDYPAAVACMNQRGWSRR